MRTKIPIIITVLFFVLVAAARAQDPEPSPSPRPSGPMVGLSLIVTDKDGKGVTSIRKDQIRVSEDKDEQAVLSVEADERPVDYVLLIDATGSFQRSFASALDAVKLFIVNRRPQDQAAILRFVNSDTIEKVQEFTTDSNALLGSLDSLYLQQGQSAVIDALYLGADYVAKHNNSNEGRRKAVVIITDGEDRISYYKPAQLIELLYETGVQVFVVGLVGDLSKDGVGSRPSPRARAEELLITVANESGGLVFFPENKEQIVASTAEILLHLRAQFRIKYQSTHDPSKKGYRKVEVKFVSQDGEKRNLITPRAYYVGPKTPPDNKSEKKKKKP